MKNLCILVEIKGGFGNQIFQFVFANQLKDEGYNVFINTEYFKFNKEETKDNTYRKLIIKENIFGLKKINVAMNLMIPSDIFMDEDDDWIQTGLNNPGWNTSSFDPSNADDLKDIKYIKDNIEPNIIFDFSMDEKGMKILKDNKILLV